MSGEKFYLVDVESDAHRVIGEMYAKREAAQKARWKFVNREFPASKKKSSGYQIVTWHSAFGGTVDWGVRLPRDPSGICTIPDPSSWKFARRSSDCIVPKLSSARGKELHAEMQKDCYFVPAATDFGIAIGIKPEVGSDFSIRSPGFCPTNDGRYIATLYGKMVPVAGMSRISDIEKEQLCEVKKPAATKPVKKAKRVAKAS